MEHRKGKVFYQSHIQSPRSASKEKKCKKADPIPEQLSSSQQGAATSALSEAVNSAEFNGTVNPVCLQHAMNVGHSKHFVLGRAAERWDSIKDSKPPAKKKTKSSR